MQVLGSVLPPHMQQQQHKKNKTSQNQSSGDFIGLIKSSSIFGGNGTTDTYNTDNNVGYGHLKEQLKEKGTRTDNIEYKWHKRGDDSQEDVLTLHALPSENADISLLITDPALSCRMY